MAFWLRVSVYCQTLGSPFCRRGISAFPGLTHTSVSVIPRASIAWFRASVVIVSVFMVNRLSGPVSGHFEGVKQGKTNED